MLAERIKADAVVVEQFKGLFGRGSGADCWLQTETQSLPSARLQRNALLKPQTASRLGEAVGAVAGVKTSVKRM